MTILLLERNTNNGSEELPELFRNLYKGVLMADLTSSCDPLEQHKARRFWRKDYREAVYVGIKL